MVKFELNSKTFITNQGRCETRRAAKFCRTSQPAEVSVRPFVCHVPVQCQNGSAGRNSFTVSCLRQIRVTKFQQNTRWQGPWTQVGIEVWALTKLHTSFDYGAINNVDDVLLISRGR